MKKYLYLSGILVLGLTMFSSCKKYLDMAPDENMTIKEVFSNPEYAERFLKGTYNYLPNEANFAELDGRDPFVGASDNMQLSWKNRFADHINYGSWGPNDVPNSHWDVGYQAIRRLNLFTENIGTTPMDEKSKSIMIGEANFLKAFFYFWMIRLYGPVPLLTNSFQPDNDFSLIKRATLEDCIDYVVKRCDTAALLLPMNVNEDNLGKGTRAAALALKSRALLYMASPLWNGNPDYAGFADNDGVKLFPDYDAERWQAAADAAKACITQCESAGYKLYHAPGNDPVKNYQDIFINNYNPEVLFARNIGVFSHQEMCAAPNSEGGWSGYCPLQNLVDAYQMADGATPITGYHPDGTPIIDPKSGYEESGYAGADDPQGHYLKGTRNMYVNREPRFYATVNFCGAMWRGKRLEFWFSGKDGKSNGGAELYTINGYLLKKFMNENNVSIVDGKFVLKTWIYFRLAEQYLNYAEALNEAQGPVADVYKYINAIRERSGLPPLPASLSKAEMRERIHHERRIELAFETHRYFDTKRWKIADSTDNLTMYGLNINKGKSLNDDEFYERTYINKRVFQEKYYLWPIAQAVIDKNPNIVQNPGWK
ncbi:RagB/SusD family nutrient uptake outer membrane protein [Compostibacter hankyongensis]|uniref:RagB/SusD family nutrient uptake outer membrane protein n=1 Tax=Compostibacter hankyongensis TaxID=1007089 RepID=A0ABP8FQU9_9BACT